MATIIVAGYLVPLPAAGYTWQALHYLLGLRALGHDVYYFEENLFWSAGHPRYFDPSLAGWVDTPHAGVSYAGRVLAAFGLAGRWCFLDAAASSAAFGMSYDELRAVVERADVFLNVSGINRLPPGGERIPERIYVDVDPVLTQVRVAAGNARLVEHLARHTRHFTIGMNVGTPGNPVPRTPGIDWRPTRPPVVLAEWPEADPAAARDALTTVTNWSRDDPVTWQGRVLGGKDAEFEAYVDLPRRLRRPLELAAGRRAPLERLAAHGWRLVPASEVAADPWRYRDYIRRSAGEWSVATEAVVRFESGWFSDRSVCYLASGRPVIVQDTGIGRHLPTGEGLLTFRTPDEAVSAVMRLDDEYPAHCRAARRVAERHFAAEAVLAEMLRG